MEIFLKSEKSYKDLANNLVNYLKDIIKTEIIYTASDSFIYIRCEYFGVRIDLEEEVGLESIIEGYEVDINKELTIEIIHSLYDISMKKLAYIITMLLANETGDLLVLDDCSKRILWRNKNVYITSDYKYFPFEEIKFKYFAV